MSSFEKVILASGDRPGLDEGQNATRHYSETFSREAALWLRNLSEFHNLGSVTLLPEAKVDTIYGINNRGKSLDVAALDDRGYLVSNLSIKSFHFKDRRTNNYRKNFTGRFYELLGETFDLYQSYKYAMMSAIIIMPVDSTEDSNPSSFALAVKQYSKILRDRNTYVLGFDFVHIALYDKNGINFFDARKIPAAHGMPKSNTLLETHELFENFSLFIKSERVHLAASPLPAYKEFKFE